MDITPRLAALRREIRAGLYRVDPGKVADAILVEAAKRVPDTPMPRVHASANGAKAHQMGNF